MPKDTANGILRKRGCRITEVGKITSLPDGEGIAIPGQKIGRMVGLNSFLTTPTVLSGIHTKEGSKMDISTDMES